MEDIQNSKTVFNAPKNSHGVIAYHTDDGQPIDDEKLTEFIENSVGPAMQEAEDISFSEDK